MKHNSKIHNFVNVLFLTVNQLSCSISHYDLEFGIVATSYIIYSYYLGNV